jgi:tetratricopeptide (TPR) repeat protein
MRIRAFTKWAPIILAMLLPAFLAAEDARMEYDAKKFVYSIQGGTATHPWTLRYATVADTFQIKALFAQAPGNRAWFSHGMWLRLIDTEKGVVVGRWRFPGQIVTLTPQSSQVRVEIENPSTLTTGDPKKSEFRETLIFDPSSPHLPETPVDWMRLYHLPEAGWVSRLYPQPSLRLSAEQAKPLIALMEDEVRRDPFAPWLRIELAELLHRADLSGGRAILEEAARLPNLDYTELLPMSAHFEDPSGYPGGHAEPELAKETFERGYRDYLQRGYDPRMLTAVARLYLYPVNWDRVDPSRHEEVTERIYRLSPAGEAAAMAWREYADQFEHAEGRPGAARVWRKRADEASAVGISYFEQEFFRLADRAVFTFALGALLAIIVFLVVVSHRYLPQGRLDSASRRRRVFQDLKYPDRRERFAFLLCVVVFLYSLGLHGVMISAIHRLSRAPLSLYMGSMAGTKNHWYLENFLPPTPERDLHLALAYQQNGDKEKAQQLYRGLPQFAESWNNLGVMLKEAGKEAEAREDFEHALQLDPSLGEAALNLGRAPSDLWTEQYHGYFPGHPMVAPPRVERSRRAFLGGSLPQAWLRALAGPVNLPTAFGVKPSLPLLIVLYGSLLLAIAWLFLVPLEEVTQPPSGKHWIFELLFPGTAPQWGLLRGVALLAWCCLIVQIGLFQLGTPYILTIANMPNLTRCYGVHFEPMLHQLGGFNPGWFAVYGAPALLFAINALIVLRNRGK